MSLKTAWRAWKQFFFEPQSPVPICIFRILYGLMVTATLLLLHADWLTWYGAHSWASLATMLKVQPGARLNLFTLIPGNDKEIQLFFWFFLLFAILLTIGLWTRVSSVIVFVCLTSLQQRNLFILHSGDTFLRVTGFFVMFAPAGVAFSVDRLLRGQEPAMRQYPPWPQRMIQFELALLYFVSFCWKSMGESWVDGTALYYVTHLTEIQRFPLPAFLDQLWILKLGSWFAMALEFSLGVLIWFKELRYPLLVLGLLFHLSLEYAFNIPLFQWDVLCAYVLFVDAGHLERALSPLQKLLEQSRFG
jgi:hypothetical protein